MADWSASASCGHWPNLRLPRKQTIEIELPNRITQITDPRGILHEDVRDVARALAATPEYMEACRRRKKVEMLFAHLKRIPRLTRLRLRGPGPKGANDEFLLAASAQNLRRLARLRPINELPEAMAA